MRPVSEAKDESGAEGATSNVVLDCGKNIYCSFCGCSDKECDAMVSTKWGIVICDKCVDICAKCVAEHRAGQQSNK